MTSKADTLEEVCNVLDEIRDEMTVLMARAKTAIRDSRGELGVAARRAEVYWLAQIEAALDSGPGSMCSMEDTIEDVRTLMDEAIADAEDA